MKLSLQHGFLCLAATAALSACTPTTAVRGNIVEDFRLAEVQAGQSTRSDVVRALGSPTTQAAFDENIWYYMGQRTEKRGIFDPKVIEERVIVVAFSEEGIVQQVEELDAKRMDVPKVRRKTPTGGNEVTIMQQVFGNLGRFNKPTQSATRTAGGGP